jgi:GT2 family glycosyltransferase
MKPRVTVLLPVWNGERYLREAIDSILSQTFRDFEFLIINDGSTDSSPAILASYHDPRIRVVNNATNLGLTRTLNHGLSLVTGEYTARQDADDISEPNRLARQVAYLDAHRQVALVGCSYKKIGPSGEELGDRPLPTDCSDLRWALLFYNPFIHSAVMFRQELVKNTVGRYNEAFPYVQDYDLWSRIARGLPVANLPEYLVKYRHSPTSMSNNSVYAHEAEHFRVAVDNLREILDPPEFERLSINPESHLVMKSLLFHSPAAFTPAAAAAAVEWIQRLHQAFCRYFALDQATAVSRLKHISSHAAGRLLNAADARYQAGSRIEARAFARLASRVDRRVVATSRNARLMFKLLAGPALARLGLTAKHETANRPV